MKTILSFLIASFVLITITAKANSVNDTQVSLLISISYDLTILPNAATNDVKISFNAPAVGDAIILVLNENGKKLLQQTTKINVGKNNINIDNFHSLNEGNYTIQLISNNETHSAKFLIWK